MPVKEIQLWLFLLWLPNLNSGNFSYLYMKSIEDARRDLNKLEELVDSSLR
jgi:hypothetical protein